MNSQESEFVQAVHPDESAVVTNEGDNPDAFAAQASFPVPSLDEVGRSIIVKGPCNSELAGGTHALDSLGVERGLGLLSGDCHFSLLGRLKWSASFYRD